MNTSAVPGFRDIFPGEQKTYLELVSLIDSETIISLCAVLNSELTCPEPADELHKRINAIASHRFTADQHQHLLTALKRYSKKSGRAFSGILFFRRYLVAMILRELNDFRNVSERISGPEAEYMFLRAYLKIVDEVHDEDGKSMVLGGKDDPMWRWKLTWLPIIGQWEMNERGNIILEMLKAGCFLEYATEHLSGPLSQYLANFGFSKPSQLMGSFQAIYKLTQVYEPNADLRRYTVISVDKDTNKTHLEAQVLRPCSNRRIGFADLKKAPIFFREKLGGYLVLDNYLAQRKVFRGPFFELFHQTELKPTEKRLVNDAFVSYIQNVADVLEKRCLKPILTLLGRPSATHMHFDDGSRNSPDGYIRVGRTIFLFEYKAYFFPDRLATNPDFEELKAYFDQRFIVNEKGKEKGIHQLRKQISIIHGGGFPFDPEVKSLIETGELDIFPIIVFNDFYFGLNGLNTYLAENLLSVIPVDYSLKLNIAPMVMMNLETILDMVLSKQNIVDMEENIVSYLDFIIEAQDIHQNTGSLDMFFASTSCFDDAYARYGRQDVPVEDSHELLEELLQLAGIELLDHT